MKRYIYERHWLRKTVVVALILFGLFAFVMPLVPGAVLAIVGLELLGIRLAFLERFYPKSKETTEDTIVETTEGLAPVVS